MPPGLGRSGGTTQHDDRAAPGQEVMEVASTQNPQAVWWVVLAGGALLVAVALAPGLASQDPDDFGRSTLERSTTQADPVETAGAAEPAAAMMSQPQDRASVAPAHEPASAGGDAVPVVTVEARSKAAVPAGTAEAPTPAPSHLEIPTLGVAVEVVQVGVDKAGLMEVPDSGRQVGWYRYGAVPGGDRGSAVLASHINTRAEGVGVLAGLGEVEPGDPVTVTLDDGTTVDYVVTDRRTVAKDVLDQRELFDRAGPARLALVTCGGPWQEARSRYRDNVIVLADPVLQPS